MRRHVRKKRFAGFLAILLAFILTLQPLAAAGPGPAGTSGYSGNTEESLISGLTKEDLSEIVSLIDFDAGFYANLYADVTGMLGTDPSLLALHFRTFGIYEGRKANEGDTLEYRLALLRKVRGTQSGAGSGVQDSGTGTGAGQSAGAGTGTGAGQAVSAGTDAGSGAHTPGTYNDYQHDGPSTPS